MAVYIRPISHCCRARLGDWLQTVLNGTGRALENAGTVDACPMSRKPMSSEPGSDNVPPIRLGMRRIERREWWLWSSAVLVTFVLTLGLVSFVIPVLHQTRQTDGIEMTPILRGLVGLVLLFDIYIVFQQLQIYRIRRRLVEREEVFRLITENAADMIAVVDGEGRRIYNSPAYQKILGYSWQELQSTPTLE